MKNKFWYYIYPRKKIEEFEKKLKMGKSNMSSIFFLNFRTFSSLIIFFMLLYMLDWGYLLSPIITFIYFKLITYYLIEIPINKRKDNLEYNAMEFFEVMALSLESGKSIVDSIEVATINVDNDLSNEFKITLEEMKYGKGLNEALDSLRERIPSDEVNSIILHISESNTLGNDIIEDIYTQIDYIRERQVLKIKAIINKIPVKVSVISVLFYIPLILLLILTPVIIEYLKLS
ncbi:MAG: type II secretion system F family protein [Bacilli bacterium]|nr:type II secretion system F family protein [Bacilli bacterium]